MRMQPQHGPSYGAGQRLARFGFTLIELLVSIAILAVLMAMMLPAVQSARQSARASQCRSHLAQLGEAFHAYHLTHGALPSGSVDQSAGLNAKLGVLAPANAAILSRIPSDFSCPGAAPTEPIGYAGVHHDLMAPIDADNNGVLYLNSQVRFNELVDGLHQTLLLGEATEVRWAEGTYGSLRNFGAVYGEPGPLTFAGVDPAVAEQKRREVRAEIAAESGEEPIDPVLEGMPDPSMGRGAADGLNGDDEAPVEVDPSRPPSPPVAQPLQNSRTIGFWPAHQDGGHFLLTDGAVRVISRSVDQQVLRRLANRLDQSEVGEF
jgi:prepilin-type N-terminal cleavage/methylation domain-containing protein